MVKYKVEALFTTKLRTQEWVRYAGPYDTRAEADLVALIGKNKTGHKMRVVEV
jgi:hypothetical protein